MNRCLVVLAVSALLATGILLPSSAFATTPATKPTAPYPLATQNPNSQPAIDVQSVSTSSQAAYEEDDVSYYNASFTTPNGPYYLLTDFHQVLTDPFTAKSFHFQRGETWINRTAGCNGILSCQGTYACDGHTSAVFQNAPQTYSFAYPCFNFYVNWTKANNLPSQPAFTVTRIHQFVVNQTQSYVTQGSNRLGYANITSYGSGMYGAGFTPSYWATYQLTWWVPYPAGNYYLAGTTFQSVDYSITYGSQYFSVLTNAFLVQWGAFPTDTATNYVYNYLFTLVLTSSGGGGGGGGGCIVNCGGGGGGGGTGGNGSGTPPGSPPNPSPQIGELILMLGNVTARAGGGFESSVIYTNAYAYNLSCEFILEASWLATASNVTVYVNSVPLPVFDRGVSSTLITIWAGVVTVRTGGSVAFSANYSVQSSFSFYGTLFYLGQTPVNIWNIVAVGSLVTVAFVIWWDIRNPERSRLQDGIVGTGLFALFVLAVVTL